MAMSQINATAFVDRFLNQSKTSTFFILKSIRVVTGKQCHNDTYIQHRYPKRDVKGNRNVSTFSKKQQRTCFTSEAHVNRSF